MKLEFLRESLQACRKSFYGWYEKIYERHIVLSSLLESLGVSPETAAEDACKIEHDISDETFDAIKKHLKKYGGSDKK